MIFNSNTTKLGTATNFAFDENYSTSYGSALALVESAQTEYAMFRAMLDVDAYETQLKYENGYVAESQITALAEASASAIWDKIVKFFTNLGKNIKSLFTSFINKITAIFMDNKKLVKKYGEAVKAKKDIDSNLKVKWIKCDEKKIFDAGSDVEDILYSLETPSAIANNYAESKEDRQKYFGRNVSVKDVPKTYNKYVTGKEEPKAEEITLGQACGISNLCDWLSKCDSGTAMLKAHMNKLLKSIDGLVKGYKAYANGTKKISKNNTDSDSLVKEETKTAQQVFEMSQAGQDIAIATNGWMFKTIKMYTSQSRAAFIKAIAYKSTNTDANDKIADIASASKATDASSSDGGRAASSSGGSRAALPSGGSRAALSSGGSGAASSSGGSRAASSSGGSRAALPSGGSGAALPSGGSRAALPSGGSRAALPDPSNKLIAGYPELPAGKTAESVAIMGGTREEILLMAIGEAAEQEVDDVINNTISKEDFDDINKATLNVQDPDVSNNPDELTYDPDKYTDDLYGTTAGTIDTEINSREESAFFGELFY